MENRLLSSLAAAVALAEPPALDVATVVFNAAGDRVAIETHWVEEGPGFPNAAVELRDVATGAVLQSWRARLTEAAAMGGFEGASQEARAAAAPDLRAAGIDLARPDTGVPCASGACAPEGASGGCVRSRDTLRVTVTSTPTQDKISQCYGRGTPELLMLSVQGRTWVSETTPADGCPADYAARTAWLHGESAVILLTHTIPGHEGRVPRLLALTGRIR